ncbi:TraB/GumN family protein [Aurantiacibacter aquimixticola]|uniref:TraB/GumN family protein n=1 Tax=Aurantiacibacter aquimixticola TaxID=1958945 RepID=UPI001403D8E8|nr:TraB/GumN family protein [Aurantiacibacter aquimixticola]
MIRAFLCVVGALWLASCSAPSASDDQDWPDPSPALWEAIGPDDQRAFLFGTIHALPDGADWRTPALERILADTDILLVEIGDLESRGRAASAFEQRAFDTGLPPLIERVPVSERAQVIALAERAEVDPASLVHTETWAAALQLGNGLACSDSANGVDRALIEQFDQVRALESYASQFDAFDTLPEGAQVALLLTIAEEQDCAAGQDRVRHWLTGDMDALSASVERGFRGNAALREALLARRNATFTERLAQMHAEEPDETLLMAVGAGHMGGADGIPALLAARDYTVRRIQ